MGARETALNVLIASRQADGWSNGLLKSFISRDRLDKRDAALATRLCYGVLQNRYKLDFYLQPLLTGKVKDLHPAIRDILHLGLYQLYEMDKVPQSAAVNESVDLAKKYCKKQRFAPGLVNGVLRNAVKTKGSLKEPASLEDKYSHPWELIKLLRDYVGKDRIEMMLKANNEAPSTTVQVNTLKISADALQQRLEGEGKTFQKLVFPQYAEESSAAAAGRGGRYCPASSLDEGLSGAEQYRRSGKAPCIPGGSVLCPGSCSQAEYPVCRASERRDPDSGLLRCPRRQDLCRCLHRQCPAGSGCASNDDKLCKADKFYSGNF